MDAKESHQKDRCQKTRQGTDQISIEDLAIAIHSLEILGEWRSVLFNAHTNTQRHPVDMPPMGILMKMKPGLWISITLVIVFTGNTFAQSAIRETQQLKLKEAVRKRCFEVLRTGIRGSDFWMSIHAAEGLTLAGRGQEVRTLLLPKLAKEKDDQRRCGLARELVRAGDEQKARIMLDILAGERSHGHVHAAESLYKVGTIGDGSALQKAMIQTKNGSLQLMAAAALGRDGQPLALRRLRQKLKSSDPNISRIAAWVLARIGDESDVRQLRKNVVAAKDDLTRCYNEHALARLGDRSGMRALERNLSSTNPAIRTYAATFVGDAGALRLAKKLIVMLDDPHLDAGIRAAQSLLVLAAPSRPPVTSKLFIDDQWIESRTRVRRVLHQPRKHPQNPLVRGDKPWAKNPYCYGTVIYDAERAQFKLWYMSYNYGSPLAERTPILYATSKNGISWKKPSLGLVAFRGSKQNNILMNHYGFHDLYSPSVLRDDHDPNPKRRYKMIWWDFAKGPRGYRDDGMCVAFSPDGIRWSKHPNNPVLHAKKQERSISDVMSVMYDRSAKKFVAYTKGWASPWPAFRQIVRTESTDFVHWTKPQVVIRHAFNKKDPQSYGMVVTQYESLYLGMLSSYKKPGNETIDIQLAISHDNRKWSRVADQATFLPTGRGDSWDDGMLFCAPFITHGDRILIYYGGWDGPHNASRPRGGIGLATLRKDGFVSLDAGDREGIVTTRVLSSLAAPLSVNAQAKGGSIHVEVLSVNGKPLPAFGKEDCVPLTSDGIRQRVRWKTRGSMPGNKKGIRLRFRLKNAKLYSFRGP